MNVKPQRGNIMDKDESLDLLDLEDTNDVDTLPEATPFSNPRPKKPWLLMGLGIAIIVLATWIIVAKIGGDSPNSVNIDLDVPVENMDKPAEPVADLNVPPRPDMGAHPAPMPAPAPVEQPMPDRPAIMVPVAESGNPVRIIEDRKDVTFNPDKPAPQPKPAAKKPVKKAATPVKKATASSTASTGGIYVQFGSYSTRAAAQSAEQKIRASHGSLFGGKQFVILAAQVKGKTTYRLRIAFNSASEANGFCRNAKSDGLDCYVTK